MKNLENILKAHKLSKEDYNKILKILNRKPNLLELGIFSAMWSEHCSYKSSKKYLNNFFTKAPWVIQGPGENAGVIDIGDGMACVFKIESHNHPSFIEPYQGAATGVGGIMRDIFTMGARPVANLNSLRFGDIKKSKFMRYLLKGVSKGIGDYGNCMGVPTIGGETDFHSCYDKNILVNAFCLGIAKKEEIFYAKADGIGNPIIYVGSKTGRDGLGGAVMSSDSFSKTNKSQKGAVQVGDPFTQKLLLEACLELFKKDYIVGIQDMGAAGLSSSAFEMAGKSNTGIIMKLEKVPMRESNMTPYELMLSESQERMLICAKKGKEQKIIEIFDKYELDCSVIGEVTNTKKVELYFKEKKVAQIPVAELSNNAPILDRPKKKPSYIKKMSKVKIKKKISNQKAFFKLLKSPEVCDKNFIYEQYDFSVRGDTIKKGGDLDSSTIRIKENNKAISMSVKSNSSYSYIDPKIGSSLAVLKSARKVALSGAKPLAISDCLNFANPQKPEVMWQFAKACEGIKEACLKLNIPVVSGNVSLYNQSNELSIYPSPIIVSVGLNNNANTVINSKLKKEGNYLYLVGDIGSCFDASLYLKKIFKETKGVLEEIDFKKELKLWEALKETKELIQSSKDIGRGGLAIALAKMSAISNIGLNVKIKVKNEIDIFSESNKAIILEIKKKDSKNFEKIFKSKGLEVKHIGKVTKKDFKLNDIKTSLNKLKDIYFNSLNKIMDKV